MSDIILGRKLPLNFAVRAETGDPVTCRNASSPLELEELGVNLYVPFAPGAMMEWDGGLDLGFQIKTKRGTFTTGRYDGEAFRELLPDADTVSFIGGRRLVASVPIEEREYLLIEPGEEIVLTPNRRLGEGLYPGQIAGIFDVFGELEL